MKAHGLQHGMVKRIAEEAAVDFSYVSQILSGRRLATGEKGLRVLAIIKRLGGTPLPPMALRRRGRRAAVIVASEMPAEKSPARTFFTMPVDPIEFGYDPNDMQSRGRRMQEAAERRANGTTAPTQQDLMDRLAAACGVVRDLTPRPSH